MTVHTALDYPDPTLGPPPSRHRQIDISAQLLTALLAISGLVCAALFGQQVVALGPVVLTGQIPIVVAAGVVMGWVVHGQLQRRFPMVPILEHEIAHSIVAVLLLGRPTEIRASERDGHVLHTAVGLRGTLVRLAPYVLPTLPWLLFPLGWVVRTDLLMGWRAAVAIGLGYQLARVWTDLHRGQTDLTYGGYMTSIAAVLGWGSLSFGGTLFALLGGVPLLLA